MVTSRNAVAFVNIHPKKSKWVTAEIILVSPASILVGEWLQRQRHIGAWPLYILFKCDVRHRLHCFVCTDTHLFNFTKGKTDLVNQRWRRTTCLKHQCYDVGCYPCILMGFKNVTLTSCYILQKTVECKLSLLRWWHHEVASSVNIYVLIVQLNSTTLLLRKVLVTETFLK